MEGKRGEEEEEESRFYSVWFERVINCSFLRWRQRRHHTYSYMYILHMWKHDSFDFFFFFLPSPLPHPPLASYMYFFFFLLSYVLSLSDGVDDAIDGIDLRRISDANLAAWRCTAVHMGVANWRLGNGSTLIIDRVDFSDLCSVRSLSVVGFLFCFVSLWVILLFFFVGDSDAGDACLLMCWLV